MRLSAARLLPPVLAAALLGMLVIVSTPAVTAQEPPPDPAPKDKGEDDAEPQGADGGVSGSSSCSVTSLGTISGTMTRSGTWSSSCSSTNRSGRYARFYSFQVSRTSTVRIDLTSSIDTYLYLLSGSGTSGSVLTYNDDGGTGRNSRISRSLSAGTYTVEATTYPSRRTGSFSLSFQVSSSSTTPSTSTAPAPSNLRVTNSSRSSVSLSWNSVSNAYRYKLERRAGFYGSWTTVSSNISYTSKTATGLACNTTYYFRVSARGDGSPYSTSFGSTSSSVYRKTSTCPTATAPSNLRATASTRTSVSLSWNSVSNAYRYKLQRRAGLYGSWTTVSSSISSTSRTVTGLVCNTTYYFRVSARGDGSPLSTTFGSTSSNAYRKTSTCPTATAPSNLRATASTRTSVSLSWNSVSNAYRYKLQRRVGTGGSWSTVSSSISSTSRTVTGLVCNITYYFRVSARGDGSPLSTTFGSTSSSNVYRKTSTCPTATAPSNLRSTASTRTSASLSWNSVSNAYRYKLQRRVGTSGSWTTVSSSISSTSRTVTGLVCNTTYYFRVSARGDGSPLSTSFGSTSSSVSRKTSACPTATAPSNLRSTSSSRSSVSLRWNSVSNAYRYKLERRVGLYGSWTTVGAETSLTSKSATSLVCNITYYFRVSARGDGSPLSTSFGSTSSNVSRKTSACPNASAPTSLAASSPTRTSIALSWNSVSNAHRYKLERSLNGTSGWTTVGAETSLTSKSATSLVCNTTYYFRVSARGDGSPLSTSFGSTSSNVSRQTSACPNASAPTSLAASSPTRTSIALSWNSVSNAHRYKLERSLNGTSGWTTVGAETSLTSKSATSLVCNTTYYFRVSARGDGSPLSTSFGSTSSNVSKKTSTCPNATAPSNLRATASTRTSIALSWNSVSNAHRYKLERSLNGTSGWTTVGAETSLTSKTATGLTCNTTYYFRISARGDGSPLSTSFGSTSSNVSKKTSACPNASAPTGLTASSPTRTSVALSWNAVSNAHRYKLERSLNGTSGWTSVDDDISGTSKSATGLTCNTTYYFRVSARGDGSPLSTSFGSTSSNVSKKTSACSTAPAPSNLSASSPTQTSVKLSWNSVSNASVYKLERSTSSSGPWTSVSSSISSASHTATGLTCNTTYYFRVSAKGDGSPYSTSFGSASSNVSKKTSACSTAPAPSNLSASSPTQTSVKLSWSAVSNASAYKLERSTSSSGPWTTVSSSISSTSHTTTGLTCNTTYYFRVSAKGDGSPYSTSFGSTSSNVSRATSACNILPVFGASSYSFSVAENAATSAAVGTVSATDSDVGDTVSYSFTDGNGAGKFAVGSTTGAITVAGDLDHETTASYSLTVRASDTKGGTTDATVTISVTDITEASITASPANPQLPGQQRVTMTASLEDSPTGAGLSYQWQEKSGSQWTTLTWTTSQQNITSSDPASRTFRVTITRGSTTVASSPTTITWANRPGTVSAPTVTAGPAGLEVSWTAPSNGGVAITGYNVRHRTASVSGQSAGSDGVAGASVTRAVWTTETFEGTGTSRTISNLKTNAAYAVQVQACNGETSVGLARCGDWSSLTNGTTGRAVLKGNLRTTSGTEITAPVGIAWDGTNLYLVDDNTDALYTVDTSTGPNAGVVNHKGDLRTASGTKITNPRALAWDGAKDNPKLYMLTADALYTLDTSDAPDPSNTSQKSAGKATKVGSQVRFGIRNSNNQLIATVDARGIAWRRSHLTSSTDSNARLEGRLYMVDRQTDALHILNTEGSPLGRAAYSDRSTTKFGANIDIPSGIEWVGSDLYMIADGPGALPWILYKLAPTTGAAASAGALGVKTPTDLAWNWNNSTLYLIDDTTNALYSVAGIQAPSPQAGTGTEQIGSATKFGLSLSNPRGIAWGGAKDDQKLYMVDDGTDALYTVNTTTGVASQVGSATRFGILNTQNQPVSNVQTRDLAWDGNNLYLLTVDTLYTLNTTDGTATQAGRLIVHPAAEPPAGPTAPFGLAHGQGGFLYMVNRGDSPALYRMGKLGTVYRVAPAIVRFGADVSNPTGLVWDGNTLYTSNIASDGAGVLYKVDKTTGIAERVGALGIDNPTDLAWDSESSTLYVVDDSTDALYKVADLHPYLPNAGDLYYNGGNFADAFMRWDNPKWDRVDNCDITPTTEDTDCSTYEHDLELEWDNPDTEDNKPQGWFTVARTRLLIEGFLDIIGGLIDLNIGSYPGRTSPLGIVQYDPPIWPQFSPSLALPNALPSDLFCTTWSDLPQFYNDCRTAGIGETEEGKIVLSFGSYKANAIEPGRDYYGSWSFNNQIGTDSTTSVNSTTSVDLYGQEGRFGEDPNATLLKRIKARYVCPRITVYNWCVFGIDGHQRSLRPNNTTWMWEYGTSFYDSYQRQ